MLSGRWQGYLWTTESGSYTQVSPRRTLPSIFRGLWVFCGRGPLGSPVPRSDGRRYRRRGRPRNLSPTDHCTGVPDGFGAGEEIKAEYVLVSVAADLVQATLDAIPDAVVIYPATTGSAVIAVPRDQQDLVQSSTGAIEDNQPVGTFTTDVERPTPPGLDRPAPR